MQKNPPNICQGYKKHLYLKFLWKKFAGLKLLCTFALALEHKARCPIKWRGGRVVDYSSLENCRTARYRGFESLSLRIFLVQPADFSGFFYFKIIVQKKSIIFVLMFWMCLDTSHTLKPFKYK
jgi:hypothetical protein